MAAAPSSPSSAPDLDAYPVIRLDHVPLLSGKLLDTAYRDVADLLNVMHSKAAHTGESVPKLAYYLQKQLDVMRLEVARRAGGDAIASRFDSLNALLSSKEKSVQSSSASASTTAASQPMISPRPNVLAQHTAVLKSSTSESRRRDRHSLFDDGAASDGQTVKSSTSESSRRPDMRPIEFKPHDHSMPTAPVAFTVALEPADVVVVASTSSSSSASGMPTERMTDYTSSNQSKKRSMKIKSESFSFRADSFDKPTDALNKNFATAFIVAATEEKKRYYPKKKEVKLTEEEVRERERQLRRDAATARLQARMAMHKRKRKASASSAGNSSNRNSKGNSSISKVLKGAISGDGADSGNDSISEEEEEEVVFEAPAVAAPPAKQPKLPAAAMPAAIATATATAKVAATTQKAKLAPTIATASVDVTTSAVPISTSPINKVASGAGRDEEKAKREKCPKHLVIPAITKQTEKEKVDLEATRASATQAANEYHMERRKSRERVLSKKAISEKKAVNDSLASASIISAAATTTAVVVTVIATKEDSSDDDDDDDDDETESPAPAPVAATAPTIKEASKIQAEPEIPAPASVPAPVPASPRKLDGVAATKSGAALEVIRRMKLERKNSLKDVTELTAQPEIKTDGAVSNINVVSPRSQPPPAQPAPSPPSIQVVRSPPDSLQIQTPPVVPGGAVARTPGNPVAFRDILGAAASPSSSSASPTFASPAKKDLLSGLTITPIADDATGGTANLNTPSRVRKRSLSHLELSLSAPITSLLMLQHADTDGDTVSPHYSCSRGPDELVGLRVWKLSHITDDGVAQWAVDMDEYRDVTSADELLQLELLRMNRSSQRHKVSAGLVALVLECESLMTGERFFESEDLLVAAWQWALVSFDDMASHLTGAQADKLFDEVVVCGNGHAVCKKLENLVKSRVFAFESHTRCFSQETAELGSGPDVVGVDDDDVDDTDYGDRDIDVDVDVGVDADDGRAGWRGNAMMEELGVERIDEEEEGDEEETYEAAPHSQQKMNLGAISFSGNTNLDAQYADDDDGDEDGDDDDDGSIMPLYSEAPKPGLPLASPRLADMQTIAAASGPRKTSPIAETQRRKPPSLTPSPSTSTLTTAPSSTSLTAAATVSNKKLPWKAVFPHFGMIFPVAHGAAGTATGLPTPNVFKSLIVCMELQSKMYDEWLEVMSDYSTALSVAGDGSNSPKAMHFRVNSSRPEVYNIVTDAFRNDAALSTWEELPSGLGLGATWNLLWTWSKPKINMNHLLVWQRVNHFHDSKQLTRKDLLKKNLQRYTDMKSKGAEAFEIMPQTFLLPHEYIHFVQAFQEIEATRESECVQNYWIMKPVGMSRGRGISIVRDVASLAYSQTSVIQRYVERPLCLNGYKFDLRLYVLVTSFRPLEAFIYKEGFARVSTQRYSLDGTEMANKFVHLTNSSIQKLNTAGPSKDNPLRNNAKNVDEDNGGGSKLTLGGPNGLWARLRSGGIDTDAVWRSICLLVLKSLVVVDDKMVHQPCSFELFGFDVLVESEPSLRPWLIEVNASPSMARENAIDNKIKNVLISDTIRLVDPPAYDRSAAARIFKRRAAEFAKSGDKSNMRNDAELQIDLDAILGTSQPRSFGEDPAYMGDYERLCPHTKLHETVLKLKAKIFKSSS